MIELKNILEDLGLKDPPCPIKWTNKHLRFFELGAFFQTVRHKWIEINPQNILAWLGYDYETVIKHELVHAMRCNFHDSFWEELIAYQTSKFSYQRFLVPFISKTSTRVHLAIIPIAILMSYFSYAYLCVLSFSCLAIFIIYFRQFSQLQAVLKQLQILGNDRKSSFVKLIMLSPDSLGKLAKKSTPSIRDF